MNTPPDRPLAAALVRRVVRRDLRRAFRRVCWAGPLPELPADAPLVLYANHHNYYDGHLLWLLLHHVLGRPGLLWMEEWTRFPLFAPLSVLPFPPDDAARRAATVRRTLRRMHRVPQTTLLYFPEGRLHPPEDGVLPFPDDAARRLARLLPAEAWWPVALHVTWWGEARPTALLAGGAPHVPADGRFHARLSEVWHTLRTATPRSTHVLLDGRRARSEAGSLAWAAPFFNRYL